MIQSNVKQEKMYGNIYLLKTTMTYYAVYNIMKKTSD